MDVVFFFFFFENWVSVLYLPITRKRSKRYNELAYESSVYHTKIGESHLVRFPTAQVNLPSCSPHCPFTAERPARKLWIAIFEVIGLTRLGIEPESTAPEANALTT